jgi:hypothetical protein
VNKLNKVNTAVFKGKKKSPRKSRQRQWIANLKPSYLLDSCKNVGPESLVPPIAPNLKKYKKDKLKLKLMPRGF